MIVTDVPTRVFAEPVVSWFKVGILLADSVPEAIFDALSAVRLTPEAAGKVSGNLASGTVPDPRFDALSAVRLAPETAAIVPEI